LFDLPSEKVIINPNGFDDKIFRPMHVNKKEVLKKLGTDFIADKVVSFVGKFTEFKGIDILIKAAKIVSQRVNDVGFYLAGDGELRKEMEKLAKNSGLKNITFLGHQTQENVALLYNIANLSVVPSRVEPFGLVAIEALACGTPVVATNAGGLPDFINENVGKLVEMDNPKALAEGIIEELKNNTKKSKGTYAAKYAKENYSWQSNLDKVIALYKVVGR
jgi:glycosyltransferase involved in cell wall biosynthesis